MLELFVKEFSQLNRVCRIASYAMPTIQRKKKAPYDGEAFLKFYSRYHVICSVSYKAFISR